MAKISTYVVDGTIVDGDKVIGSDANNDMVTKNYTIGDLVAYFAVSIGDYLVPYNNATDNVDLGAFGLSASSLSTSGVFTANGTDGLIGQVLMSQGSGQPAIWSYNIGSQDLEDVVNNGNTASRNILLNDSKGSTIKLDVDSSILGSTGIQIYDFNSSNTSYWVTDEIGLQDGANTFTQLIDRAIYSNGVNSISIVANNWNNQTFIYPNYGGAFVMSVNGVFADMSGNVNVGGGGGTVTQVNTSAPLTGGPITSSGTIGISQASASQDGYLSSTDWNTFNNKLGTTPNLQQVLTEGRTEINGASWEITLNEFYNSGDDNYVFKSKNIDKPEIVAELSYGLSLNAYFRFGDYSYALSQYGTGFVELKPSGLTLVNNGFAYSITLANPANNTANYVNTLAKGNGVLALSINNTYTTDEFGNINIPIGTGTVTQIDTTSPLTGGTITTSGTIGISQATASTDGYLSSTDWNAFNSKGNGTVTSVDLSMPSAFSVANNPVTTSGTLTVTGAGNTSQLIDGTGALQSIPTSLPPSGTAGGDLSGTYPNPNVDRIHGIDMQAGAVSADDVWVYGGSPAKWQHQKLHSNQVTNDSTVTGTDVDDALTHLNSTKVETSLTISTTSPLSGGGDLSANRTLSISQATASTNGYLSSTDWTTFNNKQNAISLTTTGTSGAATFSSNTLNIPQYQAALTNPVTGTGVATRIAFWGTSSSISSDADLYWDNGLKRLGVGTNSPNYLLQLGSMTNSGQMGIVGNNPKLDFSIIGNALWRIESPLAGDFQISAVGNANAAIEISKTNCVLINGVLGTATTYTLDVNGTFHTFGQNTFDDLAGTGTRMVVASSTGLLSTQANPVTGTGTNNQIAYFNATGSTISSLTTATYPSLTELSYVKGATSGIQTQIDGKQTDSAWVDCSSQSISGWSATTTKLMQYKLLGAKTALFMFEIVGTGTGTTATITLPFTSSAWGNQYVIYSVQQAAYAAAVCLVGASSTTLTFYANTTIGSLFTTGQARNLRGQMIINIT